MVDYSNIQTTTNPSGKKVVVIPLEEWEKIQQELEKIEIYKPDFEDAIVEIEEKIDYDKILKEQNYKPITYEKFRALANDIEWEHSLDEMLAALD